MAIALAPNGTIVLVEVVRDGAGNIVVIRRM